SIDAHFPVLAAAMAAARPASPGSSAWVPREVPLAPFGQAPVGKAQEAPTRCRLLLPHACGGLPPPPACEPLPAWPSPPLHAGGALPRLAAAVRLLPPAAPVRLPLPRVLPARCENEPPRAVDAAAPGGSIACARHAPARVQAPAGSEIV